MRVFLIVLALSGSASAAPVPDDGGAVKELAEAHRNERDVLAQESMAQWTWVMGLTSIVGMGLSAGAAFAALRSVSLSRKALTQAEKSVGETVKIGQAQSRAYVHAKEATFSTDAPDLIVRVQNTGQTPATYFSVGGRVQIVEPGTVSQSIEIGNYDMKTWPALGAGVELTVQLSSGDNSGIRETIEMFQARPGRSPLVVTGKIVYADVFGSLFESPFSFYVRPGERRFRRPVAPFRAFQPVTPDAGTDC